MSNTSHTAPPNSKELYLRLLGYAYNYKRFFIISFIGFALFAATQSLLISCIELFINLLEGKPTEWIEFLPPELVASIYLMPFLVVTLSAARGLGFFLGNFYIAKVGLNVVNEIRKQVFDKLLVLPQRYYDENNSSRQISLIVFNIEQVTTSVTRAVRIAFEDGLFLIGLLCMLLYLNWKLTLVFFAAAPVLTGLVFIAARYFRRVSRKIQDSVGKVTQITNEAVQGIQVVKSYNAENFESKRFHKAANQNLLYRTKFENVSSLQTPIMHFVIALALATLFLLVLIFWPKGEAGSAVAFISAAGALGKPIKQLSTIVSIIQSGLAAAESIFAVLDEAPESNSGTAKLENVRGDICLHDLVFAYKANNPVLHKINLNIHAGQSIALVGHSGSGKSTIASLMMRLYDATDGSINIDGHNINNVQLHELRKNISFVSQSPVIFDASIEDNIYYGSEQQDEKLLIQALKNANAWDFVSELEHGIKTEIGESGGKLSGGQRQRLAIARALYKDAPILILDEATSALDNNSEQLIQQALERLKQGRTTIIIAHRLSTVRDASMIVVLDHGRIVEQGTHDELLAQEGEYATLYNSQNKKSD